MKAKLIGHTQPVKYAVDELEHGLKNIEDMIAYCAKVSNPQGQMNLASSEKLLNYLVKHKHWSPFEMASATIEVETTRDIARQFLRHRSFSFQEFSQRYADPEAMENTFVIREARLQDPSNRQNSIDCDDEELKKAWRIKQQMIIHETKIAYKDQSYLRVIQYLVCTQMARLDHGFIMWNYDLVTEHKKNTWNLQEKLAWQCHAFFL